jgi:hypothetical protein
MNSMRSDLDDTLAEFIITREQQISLTINKSYLDGWHNFVNYIKAHHIMTCEWEFVSELKKEYKKKSKQFGFVLPKDRYLFEMSRHYDEFGDFLKNPYKIIFEDKFYECREHDAKCMFQLVQVFAITKKIPLEKRVHGLAWFVLNIEKNHKQGTFVHMSGEAWNNDTSAMTTMMHKLTYGLDDEVRQLVSQIGFKDTLLNYLGTCKDIVIIKNKKTNKLFVMMKNLYFCEKTIADKIAALQ